jgi:RND family efflux transporter MFP subunit
MVVENGTAGGRQLTGEVKARVDSALGFRVGGQIVERTVRRGERVVRGQVLARLDVDDLALGTAEAKAQATAADRAVVAAQATARRAADDERRLAPLVGAGGISPQTFDQAKTTAAAAAAELEAAQARLAAARAMAGRAVNQQRHATLVADAAGIVSELLADPGQVVQPGQPVVRLSRAGGRDAVVAIPEAMRNNLPRLATARIYGDSRAHAATLREVSGAADPVTRTFEARYALDGGVAIPPGSTVMLTFVTKGGAANAAPLLAVPLGALIDRGQGPNVWVVGRDDTVSLRPVRVQSVQDDLAMLTGGLRGGDRIVALGSHLLNKGQRVRIGSLPQ